MKEKRILYLDYLRVLSILGVVVLHVSAPLVVNIYKNGQKYWWAGNFFDGIFRVSVPILIMISGALLLNSQREFKLGDFLKRRVLKLLIPLFFWGLLYFYLSHRDLGFLDLFKAYLKSFYKGELHIHLWYSYMLLGLYLLIPILQPFVREANKAALGFIVFILFLNNGVFQFAEKFTGVSIGFGLDFFTWGLMYFILGYLLSNSKLTRKLDLMVYSLGGVSLLVTIFASYYLSLKNQGDFVDHFYSYLSPNIIFSSLALFLAFMRLDEKGSLRESRLISSFSKTGYGIYLSHLFVLRIIYKFIGLLDFHFLLGIPIISLMTLILSHILVLIILKIPLIRRLVS